MQLEVKTPGLQFDPSLLVTRTYVEAVAAVVADELNQIPELKNAKVTSQQGVDGFELMISSASGKESQLLMKMDNKGIISLSSSSTSELLTNSTREQVTKRLVRELPRINQKALQDAIRNGMLKWVKRT